MAGKANRIGVRTADKIVAIREKWHTKNHPFFVDFLKGKFGLKPVGKMMAQHYQHVNRVLPSQGIAYSKAPPDGRRHILANVAEEEGLIAGPGEDREPHDHMEMIFRFCRYAGLSDKEVKATEQLPAWRARSYFYINTVREEPFPVIVAMQSTQEGQQPALNGERMLPGFKKHFGLDLHDPRIEFFAEHYLADADHSNRQIEMVAKYITNDELAERALQVADTMVKTRWAGITEIYRTAVLGEKDPMPKGLAA